MELPGTHFLGTAHVVCMPYEAKDVVRDEAEDAHTLEMTTL